ncbi:HutD/Ves family protein [Tabrizicola sp. BL-A-41-H6]|uniref:HutD/Ves family protein n=1 Tax=Tabrizicola sp. BL-A-41-H6 TaxID=3421107 RepID=UPI003D6795FB
MIHLTPADYRRQPWANGRGTTTELYRLEESGHLILRLSMATVSENGPFSLFPGIERNLTVLTGPGFTLSGENLTLHASPLNPVAFPGDIPITASNVTAPSEDFNVMTARHLPRPAVRVTHAPETLPDGHWALFALSDARVNDTPLHPHDLVMLAGIAKVSGRFLAVQLQGVPKQFD